MLDVVVYRSVTVLDLLIALTVVVVAFVLINFVTITLRRRFKDKISGDHLQVVLKAVRYGTLVVALVAVLPLVGVNLSGLMVAGGLAGVIIGFASQNIVSNFISGLFIMFERPIKIGQSVNIEGTIGMVEDIRIMSTVVRTFEGLYVRIPNVKVFSGTLINYVANVARRFEYSIGIRYSDDATHAIDIMRGVIDAEPMALKDPEPQVFVDSLGDNSVNISVRIWAPATQWWELKMRLLNELKLAIEAEGIQIPFPQRVVWKAKESEKEGVKTIQPNPD